MTKSKFDIEFKKWLQQVDVKEDDSVWNEIQDELDFIETWDNISAKLDEVKPQKGRMVPLNYLKGLVAAAILLFLFLPVRYLTKQTEHSTIISELSKNIDEQEMEKRSSSELSPFLSIHNEIEEARMIEVAQSTIEEVHHPEVNFFERSLTSNASENFIAIIESDTSEDTIFRNKQLPFKGIQNLRFETNILANSDDVIQPNSFETEYLFVPEPGQSSKTSSSKLSLRVVDIGLVYGYKNTWLLNYETRNGLDPSKLGNVQPTFRQDIGFSSTLELNNRHLLGLEFFWKSESGQNYQQYMNASFIDKNIHLDYLKFQAFYCFENRRIPGQVLMGGYIARLTMAEEQIDNSTFSVNDQYNDLDYGVLAGYQINIPVAKKINFKPSIRFNYNLVNIFEGDNMIPGNFKDTRNLATSFNISFSYRLF